MSDILKLYFKDLTKEAQDRVLLFDSELPAAIIGSTEPMIGVRKRPKLDLEGLKERLAGILGADAPAAIIQAVAQQVVDGKELGGGFAMDKRTGKVTPLTDDELEELKKAPFGTEIKELNILDECDCPKCVAERAEKSDNGGGDPLNIVNRLEPKDPTKWD